MGSHHEKNGGRKSRDTLPLRNCICENKLTMIALHIVERAAKTIAVNSIAAIAKLVTQNKLKNQIHWVKKL